MSGRRDYNNRGSYNRRKKGPSHGEVPSSRIKNTGGDIPYHPEKERSVLERREEYQLYLEEKRRRRSGRILFWIIFLEVILLFSGLVYLMIPKDDPEVEALLSKKPKIEYETELETELDLGLAVPRPGIDVQLISINDWSRPGIKCDSISKIVVHYLGNPETTAQENHDYFESLKDLQDIYMSANYVVGLNGEIIQCVPDGEVAWASNKANYYSISIENCHEDESGRLNSATYWSDVYLVAYLTEKYDLGRDDIIRHYDVTGKICPKWYVDHPDDWEKFKDDVMAYRAECEAAQQKEYDEIRARMKAETEPQDILREYLDNLKQKEQQESDVQAETSDSDLWEVLKKKAEAVQE